MRFVGGLPVLLQAAGVDLSCENNQGCPTAELNSPSDVMSVTLPLKKYEDMKATLSNEKRLGIALLEENSSIPAPTLRAFR